ncbi:HAAS signaling domain-containing protein [Peribacillus frigoritolerans]|uniref:HAAS signaling domain-containing protein n=1 Tax=Peribacillus frigoritolerans TaxID=450367 RepID=UPI003D07E5AC
MNKEQFLKQLNASLTRLSLEEREDILQDYEEYFEIGMEEGKSEQEISKSLGNPKQISKELMATYHLGQVEQTTSAGNVMRAVWAVIGLGFFNLVIVLGPFIALIGVVIAGWVSAIAFILTPLGALFNLVLGNFQLFDLFFALGLCGIGIFIAMGMFVATSALTKGFIRYLKFNASLVKGGLKND